MSKQSLLDNLNPEQREAVCAVDGPVLIFAGAGSGKTRTLTYRIAHMVRERGISPGQILAVTFTNRAANEMKERIAGLIGEQAGELWAGTFHWFCARLLRAEGQAIGVPPNFTIYDDGDQGTLVKQVMSALNIDREQFKPAAILNEISAAKNQLLTVADYKPRRTNPLEQQARQVYRVYQEELRRAGALDFDDLLMEAVRLLDTQPEARKKYRERFRYVLVDEYQDVNFAQFRLLELLAGEHGNLCVVGDDDQSIYGWRGADVGLILSFTQHFPQARTFLLERNYRSTQKILGSANAIIGPNQGRSPKRLWTENGPGEDVYVYRAVNEEEEAEWVVDTLRGLVQRGEANWGEFAVLYRTNSMSRVLEEALMNFSVPYEVVGGPKFFERAEIKDLIAYLQVIENSDNSLALRRIINNPTRGIGDQTLSGLDRWAHREESTLYRALGASLTDEELPLRARAALESFHHLIEGLREAAGRAPLPDLVRQMVERTGYLERLRNSAKADDARRAENVGEFLSTAARFVRRRGADATLSSFLEYVALVSDLDQAENLDTSVSLLTLHSAKGLEFPYVFIVGLEEGLLPHYRSLDAETDLAEERRLLYVGMTRAQRRLWLSFAQRRMQFGEVRRSDPSRFLQDLPREGVKRGGRSPLSGGLVDVPVEEEAPPEPAPATGRRPLDLTRILSKAQAASRPAASPSEEQPAPATEWRVGQKVVHAKFGRGVIVTVKAGRSGPELVVAFPGGGVKQLDPRLAPLERA